MPYCPKCKGHRVGTVGQQSCGFCLGTGFIPDPQLEALIDVLVGIEEKLGTLADVQRNQGRRF